MAKKTAKAKPKPRYVVGYAGNPETVYGANLPLLGYFIRTTFSSVLGARRLHGLQSEGQEAVVYELVPVKKFKVRVRG